MATKDIGNIIQQGLERDRQTRASLYEPSPGQTMSHVDHRVMRVVLDTLADTGYSIVRSDALVRQEALLAGFRSERQRWYDIREYAAKMGDRGLQLAMDAATDAYVERNKLVDTEYAIVKVGDVPPLDGTLG